MKNPEYVGSICYLLFAVVLMVAGHPTASALMFVAIELADISRALRRTTVRENAV